MKHKRVIVLGSTGSIGIQALQVIAADSNLVAVGLSCAQNAELILEQAMLHEVENLALTNKEAASAINLGLFPELKLRSGKGAAAQLVREVEADIVLNAIVGFAGLEATLAAIEKGYTLALANKESLVCAGKLVMDLVDDHLTQVIPVDSEHSALFQLLESAGGGVLRTGASAIITASGGPFLGYSSKALTNVTPEQALAHPTWSMGRKISIDSATLMNKGLEIIEAHHLFALPYEKIEVLVHPQSVVHAMLRLADGALLAHLGAANMRIPIAYALRYPSRSEVQGESLDLTTCGGLTFSVPDEDTFPALKLAREAGKRGDKATCAFNAANEVAVSAFLDGKLSFSGIWGIVTKILENSSFGDFETYQEVECVDNEARHHARDSLTKFSA